MSKYVSFEISKLLKEKGFDVITQYCFHSDDNRIVFVPYNEENLNLEQTYEGEGLGVSHTSRPHISDVVDWLLEKHGIWISVSCPDNLIHNDWISYVYKVGKFECLYASHAVNTPKEAYLVAIEYTLKNLI